MKIHREDIITTAMRLLDQDGLEGVTLRKVAAALHVQVGALYWHVKNKQELLDEMANIILSEQFTEFEGPAPDQRWSDWLVMMCARLRQAMLAHREGARVVAGATLGRAVMLAQLLDLAIRSLMAAGLPLRLAYLTCMTSISYVYGFVIEEQAAPEAEVVSHIEASDESIVAAILRENQANNYDADADFKAGLELIIEGVQRKAIMLS